MQCCHIKTTRKPQRSGWRSISGCAGSGALLVLLPKCPLCIAAWLAMWTGASVAVPIATRLHLLLEIAFVASAALLLVRCLPTRTRHARA
jgi:acyl-CoA synthetase (AMP-forming)/AMP-acid ligase II